MNEKAKNESGKTSSQLSSGHTIPPVIYDTAKITFSNGWNGWYKTITQKLESSGNFTKSLEFVEPRITRTSNIMLTSNPDARDEYKKFFRLECLSKLSLGTVIEIKEPNIDFLSIFLSELFSHHLLQDVLVNIEATIDVAPRLQNLVNIYNVNPIIARIYLNGQGFAPSKRKSNQQEVEIFKNKAYVDDTNQHVFFKCPEIKMYRDDSSRQITKLEYVKPFATLINNSWPITFESYFMLDHQQEFSPTMSFSISKPNMDFLEMFLSVLSEIHIATNIKVHIYSEISELAEKFKKVKYAFAHIFFNDTPLFNDEEVNQFKIRAQHIPELRCPLRTHSGTTLSKKMTFSNGSKGEHDGTKRMLIGAEVTYLELNGPKFFPNSWKLNNKDEYNQFFLLNYLEILSANAKVKIIEPNKDFLIEFFHEIKKLKIRQEISITGSLDITSNLIDPQQKGFEFANIFVNDKRFIAEQQIPKIPNNIDNLQSQSQARNDAARVIAIIDSDDEIQSDSETDTNSKHNDTNELKKSSLKVLNVLPQVDPLRLLSVNSSAMEIDIDPAQGISTDKINEEPKVDDLIKALREYTNNNISSDLTFQQKVKKLVEIIVAFQIDALLYSIKKTQESETVDIAGFHSPEYIKRIMQTYIDCKEKLKEKVNNTVSSRDESKRSYGGRSSEERNLNYEERYNLWLSTAISSNQVCDELNKKGAYYTYSGKKLDYKYLRPSQRKPKPTITGGGQFIGTNSSTNDKISETFGSGSGDKKGRIESSTQSSFWNEYREVRSQQTKAEINARIEKNAARTGQKRSIEPKDPSKFGKEAQKRSPLFVSRAVRRSHLPPPAKKPRTDSNDANTTTNLNMSRS